MGASFAAGNERQRPTIGNIQSLRFLAAMWVLLYHVRPPLAPEALTLLPQGLTRMGFMGVDVFFVISGAIMAETTRGLAGGATPALRFLSARCARVYAGWWPFFLIYWLAYEITGNLRDDKRLLASFFLWPQDLPHYLLPITWSLSFELAFYGLVALLVLWNRAKAWLALMAIGAALVFANVVFWSAGWYSPLRGHEATLLHKFYASPLFLELMAGFLLSELLHGRRGARLAPWGLALVTFGTAAYAYQNLVPLVGEGMAGHFHLPERVLLGGGFAVALVGCAVVLEQRRISPMRWMQRLGDASYSLYLCHPLIIATMFLIAQKIGIGVSHPSLAVLAVAGAATCYSVAHYRWIERPIHGRLRELVGRLIPRDARAAP
jgi:exopolysaccharide production protein ExoZ